MPRSKGNSQSSVRNDKLGDISYVSCDLGERQREDLRIWADGIPSDMVLVSVENLAVTGHTISIKKFSDGYQCSVTGTDEDHAHHRQYLIARASTPLKALKVAIWKHYEVLNEQWPLRARQVDLDL